MFGRLVYDILFFAIPIAVLALFGISLFRFLSAKSQNKNTPGSVSADELKKRGTFLAITFAVAAVLLLVVIGFIALLFMAVAFM